MDITYQYQKKRSEFGKQCLFTDKGPDLIDNYQSNHKFLHEYIYRDPVHVGVQNVTTQAEHELNTYRAEYADASMNHIEGGWPKDVNLNDEEQTKRYRRKVEKDEGYPPAMQQLCKNMEECILQNNAINIYQQYYTDVESTPLVEPSSARTVNVFHDQCATHRPVTHISWLPEEGTRIAITHCNMKFQAKIDPDGMKSFIWELENPNEPQMVLQCPTQTVCIEYNPRDANILGSGQFDGLVAVWDVRSANVPMNFSLMESSHRDPIHSVIWTHSKTGTEIMSGSTDGTVKWWDTRKLDEPIETLIVDMAKAEEQSMSNALGVSVLEYEVTIPTRFMMGTETGMIISGNRKGKTPLEKMIGKYNAHQGPVLALRRNPAFVKNFLSVGDWTARIWSEECKESSIMWTHFHKCRLLDAAWSPTRYSVFFTCRSDGILDIWDILQSQEKAVLSVKVCDVPLTRARPNELGRLTAAGNEKGTAYVIELCEQLCYSNKNDKALLTAMFERESRREKILEARNREMRLKQKDHTVQAAIGMEDQYPNLEDFLGDPAVQTAEKEFLAFLEQETKGPKIEEDTAEEGKAEEEADEKLEDKKDQK